MKVTVYPLDTKITDIILDEISKKLNHNDIAILPSNLTKCDKFTLNKLHDVLYSHDLELTVKIGLYPGTEQIKNDGYSVLKKANKSRQDYYNLDD